MLQSIRELSKTWIFKGLMTLLVVSFGIWGVGDMFRTHPGQRVVARVGKVEIPVQELEFRFQQGLAEARNVFGKDLTPSEARRIGVLDRTLNVMVNEYAFDQAIKKMGLNLDETVAFRWIAKQPEFKDRDGKFNTRLWKELVGKTGLAEKAFLDQERRRILRDLLVKTLISNTEPPQLLVDNMYQSRGAKRILEMVILQNSSIQKIPEPTQTDLEDYYKEHEASFAAPEYRGFTVARLNAEDLGRDISISEDDLRKAYETREDELTLPETRDLVQIVFRDEQKAKDFRSSIGTGEVLEVAAKAKGLTSVPLSKVNEKDILPELYATVFGLAVGDVSDPIKSPLGWHVLQLKKVNAGGKPSFEQVKKDLRERLQEERLGDAVARAVNQLDDFLAEGKTIEDIADTLKLRLSRFSAMDAQGRTPAGVLARDIPAPKETVLQTAFGLQAEEASQVLDDREGNYFVVRVDQIVPSRILSLEEVKDKVVAGWKAEKRGVAATAVGEEMAKALREGAKATSFASRSGVEVRLSKPFSLLGEVDREIPVGALANVFKMKRGDVITASAPDKQFVLRLADIVPVDPQKPEASRGKVVEDLKDRLRLDYLEQYDSHLKTLFPVKIDGELLTNLKRQEAER